MCDGTSFRCECATGFTGGDCSLRTCPTGQSWFGYPSSNNVAHDVEMECSNMGICHRTTGECSCNDGFFGSACEFMDCSFSSCNGHGSCLSMRELGLLHPTSSPVASSSSQNSLATTFDGPNGDSYADGDKFSIITGSTAVSIERLDIHMAAVTEHVEIWTKDGYPVWWNDNTWTKIWEGTIIGQGQGVATPLPAFSLPIELAANSVLGVYTLLDDYAGNNMFHSTGQLGQNEVFASDDYISIGEGISSWHMHANFQQPTRWNGKSPHFYIYS